MSSLHHVGHSNTKTNECVFIIWQVGFQGAAIGGRDDSSEGWVGMGDKLIGKTQKIISLLSSLSVRALANQVVVKYANNMDMHDRENREK